MQPAPFLSLYIDCTVVTWYNIYERGESVKRICKFCGKEFEAVGTAVYCEGPHYKECVVCGNKFEWKPTNPSKTTCSRKCARALAQRSYKEYTKICELCGEPFTTVYPKQIYCDRPHYRPCPVCGKPVDIGKSPDKVVCCSNECSKELRKRTSMEKYGTAVPSQSDIVRDKLRKVSTEQATAPKIKMCIICGEPFVPKSNAQRICDRDHYKVCAYCGKPFLVPKTPNHQKCCSPECTQKLREQTMIQRYGVPYSMQNADILQKSKETMFKHYGYDSVLKSPEFQNRIRNTFIERYGVDHPSKLPDFIDKVNATCLERYGVAFPTQIPGRTEAMQKTNMEKYGALSPSGNSDIADVTRQHNLEKYGVPYTCMRDECREQAGNVISKVNRNFAKKLSEYGLNCSFDTVKIDRYSYDLHIEGTNILIEINPTYTHNTVGNHWGDSVATDYHKRKTMLAAEHGYHCVNVWDWDSYEKVMAMFQPKIPLYARKCELREVDSKLAGAFENTYHLQSSVRGQKVCLGLFYNEQLVQLMTFGTPRYNHNYQWELLRLCTDVKYAITGGAEKLWSYFLNKYTPDSVISYCDASKFTGAVYGRLGMTLDFTVAPNKIWSKGKEYITHNLLLQRGYDQMFNTDFGKGVSNDQLMLDNGWLPVYDCGQYRYVWHSDSNR